MSRSTATILRARAAVLSQRVQRLGRTPHHPFTRAEIAALDLDVANLRALLAAAVPPADGPSPDLGRVSQQLEAVAVRLDDLEALLRVAANGVH